MKRRAWKWALGLLASVALAFGGLLWSAHRRADEVFNRHDAIVKEAIAAIRSRSTSRLPLFGPAMSGDGWAVFQNALSGMSAMTEAETEIVPSLAIDPLALTDREALRQLFEKYAPVVDDLRKAARHDKFIPAYPYESGLSMDMSNATAAIRTARYLSSLSAYAHEEGRDADALELLTLGIVMGHDTGRGGTILNHLVMIVSEGTEVEALREMLAEHSLEAADLESLARRLDQLWAGRPSLADAYEVEEAVIRRTFVDLGTRALDPASLGGYQSGTNRSWRYLFSERLAYAGALGELEAAFRETRTVSSVPTHLRPAAMEKVSARVMATGNPVIRSLFPGLARVYLRDNVAQLSWTLMRVATALAWYESEKGRVPEKLEDLVPRYLPRVPLCPLTGLPLGYRDGVVWSAGKNGVDDGGTPGKNNDADDDDGDVVWRVTRE